MTRVALVTGGGGDIGAAIGARAGAAGYRVCLVDRDAGRVDERARGIAGALGVACDVADEASVEAAFDACAAHFGAAPDLVVSCAGIARFGPLLAQTVADFRAVVDVNLVSAFIVGRAAARRMQRRGSGAIVNITSIYGVVAAPNSGAYPAAKAGLARLTELMAAEWGPLGLTVNAVAPGSIDAGLSTRAFADPEARRLREQSIPARRIGSALDIAEAVLFLGSDAARFVNGHELVVDGGETRGLMALRSRPLAS